MRNLSYAEIGPRQTLPSLEWIAGFFDGEGSVSITPFNGRMPRIQMCIGNTNIESLQDVQRVLGGYIYHRPEKGRWKPHGQLRWWDGMAVEVLRQLFPYLRVKRLVAENAIEFWNQIRAPRNAEFGKKGRWKNLSESEREAILMFVSHQRELNKVGVGIERKYAPVFLPPGHTEVAA